MPPECLVIRRGGLGDTLLMLPVLAALRRSMPGTRICFAGVREYGDVLLLGGSVDRVVSSESLQLWALHTDQGLPGVIQTQLIQCVCLVTDDPGLLRAGLPGRVLTYDPRPTGALPLAVQIGAQLGLEIDLSDAVLRIPSDRISGIAPSVGVGAKAAGAPRPVVLAPGSGGAFKCWPREQWLDLADRLAATALPLAIVVGPTEVERADPRPWPWPLGTAFWDTCTCCDLALRLAKARAFVGNDSGVTHLSGALGVPTVAVFGPTDPRVWAPPQRNVRVVRRAGLEAGVPQVSAEEVELQLRQLIQ